MTRVAILSVPTDSGEVTFRAFAGRMRSEGRTAGEALDRLTSQLDSDDADTLVIVQHMRPDKYFGAESQQRLAELMDRWRSARDSGHSLPPEEQAELDGLIEAELRAVTARTSAMLDETTA